MAANKIKTEERIVRKIQSMGADLIYIHEKYPPLREYIEMLAEDGKETEEERTILLRFGSRTMTSRQVRLTKAALEAKTDLESIVVNFPKFRSDAANLMLERGDKLSLDELELLIFWCPKQRSDAIKIYLRKETADWTRLIKILMWCEEVHLREIVAKIIVKSMVGMISSRSRKTRKTANTVIEWCRSWMDGQGKDGFLKDMFDSIPPDTTFRFSDYLRL